MQALMQEYQSWLAGYTTQVIQLMAIALVSALIVAGTYVAVSVAWSAFKYFAGGRGGSEPLSWMTEVDYEAMRHESDPGGYVLWSEDYSSYDKEDTSWLDHEEQAWLAYEESMAGGGYDADYEAEYESYASEPNIDGWEEAPEEDYMDDDVYYALINF